MMPHSKLWQVLLQVLLSPVQQCGQRRPQHPRENLQLLTCSGHAGDLSLVPSI